MSSATIETNVSWRRRRRQASVSNIQIEKPQCYYYRLQSESSIGSEDTESIYSIQDKETDVVRDTSDTSSKSDDNYELIEYEVNSLSESEKGIIGTSSSDSEDHMMFAAAITAAICDSSLEKWITDGEESDNSSLDDSAIITIKTVFRTCAQCRAENKNPLYTYCEKCFKDRKKIHPPRPRGYRKSKRKANEPEPPVKLGTLMSCLKGLSSQDSDLGSSQECPLLDLDQILVPDKHLQPGTSLNEVTNSLQEDATSKEHVRNSKRKRYASDSSLSDVDIKKLKFIRPKLAESSCTKKLKLNESNSASVRNQTSSFISDQVPITDSGCSSQSSEQVSLSQASTDTCLSQTPPVQSCTTNEQSHTSGCGSDINPLGTNTSCDMSKISKSSNIGVSDTSELCIVCNAAPKDSIFLHANTGHQCCCYKCAKRIWNTIKRCPMCNRSVNKVVKIFK